jgi:hypothetical protein
MKVHIANDLPGRHIIQYVLQLMAFNKGVEFSYVAQPHDADLLIDSAADSDFVLDLAFYQKLTAGQHAKPKIDLPQTDLLAHIFYLVNCLQEYNTETFDRYGRFPYLSSIQQKEGLLHENTVQLLIDQLWSTHHKLSHIKTATRKSGFFLTHDIDTVYGAKNQNGAYALQHHKYFEIPRLLWNHYISTPDWINIDKIMAIEEQFGFKSAFYWLVYQDKLNADYDIAGPVIQKQLQTIRQKGFEIGLHKSLRSESFTTELQLLNKSVEGQRYHFLKFNLPEAWGDIEKSGLKLDTSLGFSEDFGFRNSYGLPFMPFNIKENRVYDFIEVSMNVMDGNFFYNGKTVAQAEKLLIDWLDKNKENTIITLNFHNNFFDRLQYKGYEELYITLLKYFKEEGFKPMQQKDLIQEFYKPDLYKLSRH